MNNPVSTGWSEIFNMTVTKGFLIEYPVHYSLFFNYATCKLKDINFGAIFTFSLETLRDFEFEKKLNKIIQLKLHLKLLVLIFWKWWPSH